MREHTIVDDKMGTKKFVADLRAAINQGNGMAIFPDGPDSYALFPKDDWMTDSLMVYLLISAAMSQDVDPVEYINKIYHDAIDEYLEETAPEDDDDSEVPVDDKYLHEDDCDNCEYFSEEEGCGCTKTCCCEDCLK